MSAGVLVFWSIVVGLLVFVLVNLVVPAGWAALAGVAAGILFYSANKPHRL